MEWLKRVWKTGKAANDAYGFITSELVKPWLLPAAAAAVTTLSAVLTAVPLPYLLTGAFVSAAATATALVRVDEWRERTNPSGRLTLEAIFFAPEIDGESDAARLESIQLGLQFKNRAGFVMHYQVEEFEAQVMGRVAMEAPRPGPEAEIPPGDTTIFRDRVIEVDAPISKGFAEGRVKFKAAYWRASRRKYRIERSLRVRLWRDSESGEINLSSSIE